MAVGRIPSIFNEEDIHGRCLCVAHDRAGGAIARSDRHLQFAYRREIVIYIIAAVSAVGLLVYLTVSLLKPEWF